MNYGVYMKIKILKLPSANTEEGFTIIDVIVGMLIASIFLLVSGQAMLLAAYSRLVSQQYTEGLLLIQQDLEEVRYNAALLGDDSITDINDSLYVTDDEHQDYCGATVATDGYAQALVGVLLPNNPTTKLKINTIEYNLTRTATVSPTSPFNVLQLTYLVKNTSDNKEVATLYTEVIPDAAFNCN